jgi:hypothetical protein
MKNIKRLWRLLAFLSLVTSTSYANAVGCAANTNVTADCDDLLLNGAGVVTVNAGVTVSSVSGVAAVNAGASNSLVNAGVIRGNGGDGFHNNANLTTLNNSGTIRSFGPGGQFGIENNSTISNIYNSGTIGGLNTGLKNNGTISSLINASGGSIGGGGTGLTNDGNIGTLTNIGRINQTIATNDIVNNGVVRTLNNFNSGVALVYFGQLPENYNIVINSPSSYGRLSNVGGITGSTSFGIYSGSIVSKGTYLSVLSGVTRANLNNTTGTYNGFRFSLINSAGNIWDLIISGSSTADTQQSLINTASVLQGVYTLQNSVMVNGFTYDCSLFDKHGVCASTGGRNTTVQAQGINNTSGLLIASYRLDKNNSRIGAWVDQNLSVSSPSPVRLSNSTPMIGLFGVWSQRPDGVGAEVKVSAAYGQKDATITRQIVGTSEAGSGSSQLISQGAQVMAKYGFAVVSDVVISPYAGVRYTQNNMGGYTEATTSAVTAPLTYLALNTNTTTTLAGAEARYRGIPKTTLFASAGVETDMNTNNDFYSATGVDGLVPINFNPNPVKTRPTATVGGYYDIVKNQRIGITGIYRQEAYQAVSTTAVLATYTIGL